MVGFNPENQECLSKNQIATAGALSGTFTRAIVQPLDVLKIRFQLQIEPISKLPSSKYQGMYQAAKTIVAEEGVKALWKGHVPAQILSISYGIVQFVTFESLTKTAWDHLPKYWTQERKPLVHFVCGGLSGAIATFAAMPFDVIRTRLIGQGEPKTYNGFIHSVSKIFQVEGITSFYRGLTPSLIQMAPYSSIQFGSYTFLREVWKKYAQQSKSVHAGWSESFVCGMGAGIIAKTAVYPLDLIKKRLQIQGFHEARKSFGKVAKYSGFFNCIYVVVKEEKIRGLYKGLVPTTWKAALSSGLHFCFYEQLCRILHIVTTSFR